MKLTWKGKYTNENQLLIGNLPDNAVKFKGAENTTRLMLESSLFAILSIIIIAIFVYLKRKLNLGTNTHGLFNLWGAMLSFLFIIPHELLHAIAVPKNADVQIWYSVKSIMPFTYFNCKNSKLRFIFIGLLPTVILGIIPFIIWIFTAFNSGEFSKILFTFSTFNILNGCGDIYHVYRVITQMPNKAFVQFSRFNLYWYPAK
ncbi:DUF3267 domain-containing protein [Clostridium sp. C2-6-12]|uniref:DUF3267 domain-containing protein n=1 Tax=Clostridium sp. C2-6-12 TaxID=2698832 RepID=UPI0013698403|nr:DUF3267 domain-containing protein [Clostridium sp. C2-6-12]